MHTQDAKRRLVVFTYDIVGTAAIALAIFALMFAYLFRIVGVDGDSMAPTLQNGDRLLLSISGDKYEHGDVIVVDRYTDKPLVKRVIAVGGDTLEIASDGSVSVNGDILEEPYIRGITVLNDFSGRIEVPKGYLFVMGDNRTISKDSRKAEIGLVSVKDVVGRAFYCVWPPKNVGEIVYTSHHRRDLK